MKTVIKTNQPANQPDTADRRSIAVHNTIYAPSGGVVVGDDG
jgi:hypothetical protein